MRPTTFHEDTSSNPAPDWLQIEDIQLPAGAPPEVGAIDFAADGTLFVVLRRGDVFRAKPVADPAKFDWQWFASGFDNGCGIDVISPSKIRISQMAEMTEAEDTDQDGRADRYTRFAHGWGLSGNYHETNALTRDGKGGYYIAVGTASHSGPTFEHTLGTYSTQNSVTLRLGELVPRRVYRFQLPTCESKDGSPLQNTLAFYTVNAVPE